MTNSAVIAQFKRPSGVLGRLAGRLMEARPSNRRRNRWTLHLLDLKSDDRVFELGCGPGYALSLAAARVRNGFVTGVDHSPVMTAMAQRRLRGAMRGGRANVITGDELQLKVFERSLSAIYSANVVQFLNDPGRYFALAYDALAPSGRIATTYMPRGADASEAKAEAKAAAWATLLRDTGFEDLRVERLSFKKAVAICVLARKPGAPAL